MWYLDCIGILLPKLAIFAPKSFIAIFGLEHIHLWIDVMIAQSETSERKTIH